MPAVPVSPRSGEVHEARRSDAGAGDGANGRVTADVRVVEEVEALGYRAPPVGALEHARAHLVAQWTQDHPPWCGKVGQLPAVLRGDPQALFAVRKRRVRGHAVKDQDVARLVVGGAPAALESFERPVPDAGTRLAPRLEGEPAQPGRYGLEGDPAGEHVLDGAEVLVHHVAGVAWCHARRVHDTGHLQGIAEALGTHDLAHEPGQGRVVGDGVEARIEQDLAVTGVRHGVAHGHGPHREPGCGGHRVDAGFGPAGDLEGGQSMATDVLDPVGIEEAAHEDVTVPAQDGPQRVRVAEEVA